MSEVCVGLGAGRTHPQAGATPTDPRRRQRPALTRTGKGRSSDTQLHTTPNSGRPQGAAVRRSARRRRGRRRRSGPDEPGRAGRGPVGLGLGQRPRQPGAGLRRGLDRVRRAAHGPRGRVVRPDPLGLQPRATARPAATDRCTSSTPTSAPVPTPRASGRPSAPEAAPVADTLGRAARADRPRRGRTAHRRGRQHPRRCGPARRHAEAPRAAHGTVHRRGPVVRRRRRRLGLGAGGRRGGLRRRHLLRHRVRRLAPDRRRQGGLAAAVGRQAPTAAQVDRLGLLKKPNGGPVDCPPGLDCEWVPAPYEQYGPGAGDYGNHDLAERPRSPKITNIVIHDTEAHLRHDAQARERPDLRVVAVQPAQRPTATSPSTCTPQDVGWHAGNWYVNSHSIGLEHEGFAPPGAEWFSEPMYRSSARLVTLPRRRRTTSRSTCSTSSATTRYRPRPRAASPACTGTRAPTGTGSTTSSSSERRSRPTSPVRPRTSCGSCPASRTTMQPVTGCTTAGVACRAQGTNFVYLHTQPSETASRSSTTSAASPTARRRRRTCPTSGPGPRPALTFAVAERQR